MADYRTKAQLLKELGEANAHLKRSQGAGGILAAALGDAEGQLEKLRARVTELEAALGHQYGKAECCSVVGCIRHGFDANADCRVLNPSGGPFERAKDRSDPTRLHGWLASGSECSVTDSGTLDTYEEP